MLLSILLFIVALLVVAALWMAPYVPGMPGIRAAKTAVHKRVFFDGWSPTLLPAGKVINGTKSRDPSNTSDITVLQAGLLMGKVSATSDYAPSIIGVTTGALAAGGTTFTVSAAVATELARRIGASGTLVLTGPPAANGIVVSETITYSGISGTTVTCTASTNAFIAGSFIGQGDGSQTPLTMIPDGYGIPIADGFGTVQSQLPFPELPVAGQVDVTKIINYPTDTSLIAWLQARLNDINGGQFVFTSRY